MLHHILLQDYSSTIWRTTFELGKAKSSAKEMSRNGQLTFVVPVMNTGKCAGAETIQLYVHDVKASVERPVKELKCFRKVYLQPGEQQLVELTINEESLSFYDERSQAWKVEPGDFEALIGTSCDAISSRIKFKLKE